MAIARSRVTSQGRISVPSEIRQKLGIGPGSVLEWALQGDHVVVRRLGRFSSEDIHRAIFGSQPASAHTIAEMKEGIRRTLQKRHPRD